MKNEDSSNALESICYAMEAYNRDGPDTPAEAHLKKNAVKWIRWLLHENLVLRTKLEIAGWPKWKKEAYNANFATSAHSTKI